MRSRRSCGNAAAAVADGELHHVAALDGARHDLQLHMALAGRPLGMLDGLARVFQQVDRHLFSRMVHHQTRQARRGVDVEAHHGGAAPVIGQLSGVGHHLRDVGQRRVGLAFFDEGADALNDVARRCACRTVFSSAPKRSSRPLARTAC